MLTNMCVLFNLFSTNMNKVYVLRYNARLFTNAVYTFNARVPVRNIEMAYTW